MSEDSSNNKAWNTNSGSFIKRPGKGWLHDDQTMQEGIAYQVKVSIVFVFCYNIVFAHANSTLINS
jgi:hypothetical protein